MTQKLFGDRRYASPMTWQPIFFARVGFWVASGLVLFLSLMPSDQLPPVAFDVWDKAQHAVGFLVLGVLGFWAYAGWHRRVLMGLLLFGAVIELLQSMTGWRHGDWLDWLADSIGVMASYLLFRLWLHRAQ